ncbi:uncharacterized protein EV420DRAFT_1641212 [Desarmillaria tabescens]|uniref:Uncharacterized protein n=1 Tax=Armillaria tabescens TaxID=1929756 RepID=A0AA39N7X5_ARMTA|nr:uncharacterized protein EV420DRAFT_1641212 [Desarmillaria tabescens]KAK0460673.1 hypothetical protein EV420DRAFT_1641212 [Desarmillaria tabescens]
MRSGLSGRFFSRICETDLRWLVIAVTVINFFRLSYSLKYALLNSASQLNAFHDADVDSSHQVMKLGTVSITLGVVFFATCLIEIFGTVSAVTRQLTLIRIYVDLTFLSAVSLAAAGVINAIAYFAFADDIIEECKSLASSGDLGLKSLFRGSPWQTRPIFYSEEARTQCGNAWSNHASSEILSILFFYLIPSTFSYLLAYTYHRQMHAQKIHRRRTIRMEQFVNNSVSLSPVYDSYSDQGSERPKAGNRRAAPLTSPVKGSRWSDSSTVTVSLSPGPPSYSGAGKHFGHYDVQLTGYTE